MDVCGIGESDLAQVSLATGEAIACLNYLMYHCKVRCDTGDDGTLRYSPADAQR